MSTWYNDDLDVKFRLNHRAPVFISGGDVPSGRDPELTWLVVMTKVMTKVMTLMTSHPESLTRSVTRTTLVQFGYLSLVPWLVAGDKISANLSPVPPGRID